MTDTLVTLEIKNTRNISQGEIETAINYYLRAFPFNWVFLSLITKSSSDNNIEQPQDKPEHLLSESQANQTLRSVPGGT